MQGCDGSVLLDSNPYGGKTEKEAENNIGLDGFDVIDKIKSDLDSPENAAEETTPSMWYLQFGNAMAKLSKLPAEGKRFDRDQEELQKNKLELLSLFDR
jgi:hypothetical protein